MMKCKADQQTRLHNALVRCLAGELAGAGMRCDVEVTMSDLHLRRRDGTIREARMDLLALRPGSPYVFPVDVRALDGDSRHGHATVEKAMHEAGKTKQRRYHGRVRPLVFEIEGGHKP